MVPHLHSGNCIIGALEYVALSSLCLLRSGCHGIAVFHCLCSCAWYLLCDVCALVRRLSQGPACAATSMCASARVAQTCQEGLIKYCHYLRLTA